MYIVTDSQSWDDLSIAKTGLFTQVSQVVNAKESSRRKLKVLLQYTQTIQQESLIADREKV